MGYADGGNYIGGTVAEIFVGPGALGYVLLVFYWGHESKAVLTVKVAELDDVLEGGKGGTGGSFKATTAKIVRPSQNIEVREKDTNVRWWRDPKAWNAVSAGDGQLGFVILDTSLMLTIPKGEVNTFRWATGRLSGKRRLPDLTAEAALPIPTALLSSDAPKEAPIDRREAHTTPVIERGESENYFSCWINGATREGAILHVVDKAPIPPRTWVGTVVEQHSEGYITRVFCRMEGNE